LAGRAWRWKRQAQPGIKTFLVRFAPRAAPKYTAQRTAQRKNNLLWPSLDQPAGSRRRLPAPADRQHAAAGIVAEGPQTRAHGCVAKRLHPPMDVFAQQKLPKWSEAEWHPQPAHAPHGFIPATAPQQRQEKRQAAAPLIRYSSP